MNTFFYCRIIVVVFCLAVAFPSPATSSTTAKPAEAPKPVTVKTTEATKPAAAIPAAKPTEAAQKPAEAAKKPAEAAKPAPKPAEAVKPAAKPTEAAKPAPQAVKYPKGESPDELTKRLHEFGVNLAASYNRTVLGSKAKKDIKKNADGSFTATYHEIDVNTISGTYRDSSNPTGPVKYIGTLTYAEVTYTNTAPTQAEAEKGPFRESRTTTTELIKYVKGKWSY